MSKRIISLLLAVLLFAALPFAGAFAEKEQEEYTVGAETMKMICEKQGLDYEFCKAAIIKINAAFNTEADFTSMTVGQKIQLPKTNQAASEILGVALPEKLKPKATGETQEYTIKTGDTMIAICKAKGLSFDKCKAAIMKLNGWTDYNFLSMKAGTKIKLPKTDADAATIAASTGTATGTATGITPTNLFGNDAVAAYMVPYIVKTGETIYGICQANGIDFNRYVNLIMQASGITYATNLHTGDVIFLPSGSSVSGSMNVVAHTVAGGETVYGICQALGIDYNARYNLIVALNPNKNLNAIHTGDVIYLPAGNAATTTTGGKVTGTGTGTTAGGAGAYTPAASNPAVTQETPKAAEGVMFYLKEYSVVADDTVYNLLTKTESMPAKYFNYYVSVMMAADGRATYSTLKAGDKILLATKNSAGAKIAVTGVKVKTGDTFTSMCETAGIVYNDNANLIAKLNPNLNATNLKTGDIVLLPVKP